MRARSSIRASLAALLAALLFACTTTTAPAPADRLERAAVGARARLVEADVAAAIRSEDGPSRRWPGSANLLFGARWFESDLKPVRNQGMFGADVALAPGHWPVQLEAAVLASGATDENVQGTFADESASIGELSFGVRKTFGKMRVRPYLGTGIAFSHIERTRVFDGIERDDDDTAIGVYAHAGVGVAITRRLQVGIDVRGTFGPSYDLFGRDDDASSLAFAFLFGWHW